MIMSYREIIAADYAYNFYDAYARLASASLQKQWQLNKEQREDANRLRADCLHRMSILAQEKTTLYAKKTSITSVALYLEQLERQLRSVMPQHVMDMLGQSAHAVR